MLCIVEDQRDLRKAHRRPLLGTAEDHIFHLGAAKGLGTLLTHDPADGVRNIGFTGAVGTDDSGDVLRKVQNGLIREGLEALNFKSF